MSSESLADAAVRQQLNAVFEERGLIVFEDVEPSSEMQVAISTVFGELKDHPVASVERVDAKKYPGVITIRTSPNLGIVEINGEQLMTWQPWHFDHSYNNELNRAGVLRADAVAPEKGQTAFVDGIQIYNDMDPAIRAKIEGKELLYSLDLRYSQQRYGLPATFREIRPQGEELVELANRMSLAIHPAVWTRGSGEKVLHMSPFGGRGIEGMPDEESTALLNEVWAEVERVMRPYFHSWKPTDMLIWDNWRTLHQACGCDPKHNRVMHRTTIKGDYGFGRWRADAEAKVTAEATA